jgi:pentatricopeptide repeat protein
VDEEGNDTPPILVPNSTADNRAVNLPEFVNIDPERLQEITTPAVEYRRQLDTARELKDQGEIELKDDYWETHLALADVRARRGETSAAIEHYRKALELNPRYFYTLNNLATALNRAGRFDEAIEMYGEALEVNPASPLTHLGRGKALARRGQPELAVAYAGAGRFDDAVRTAERAADLARRHDRDALASEIEKHVAMFKQGRPLRFGG